MYRCGNKVEIGDCITIAVSINVEEMTAEEGDVAVVLEANYNWSGIANPLLTIKRPNDLIEQIPAS